MGVATDHNVIVQYPTCTDSEVLHVQTNNTYKKYLPENLQRETRLASMPQFPSLSDILVATSS